MVLLAKKKVMIFIFEMPYPNNNNIFEIHRQNYQNKTCHIFVVSLKPLLIVLFLMTLLIKRNHRTLFSKRLPLQLRFY